MIYKIYVPKKFEGERKLYEPGYQTVDTNFKHVTSEIAKLSDGFTVYDAKGYWKGLLEDVWVFEIIRPLVIDIDSPFVLNLETTLRYLKSCLNQEAMFYTRDNEGELL